MTGGETCLDKAEVGTDYLSRIIAEPIAAQRSFQRWLQDPVVNGHSLIAPQGTSRPLQVRARRALEMHRAAVIENRTLSFVASASIWIGLDPRVTGVGTFEWESEGSNWRLVCTSDGDLEFSPDLEVAFDGEKYQLRVIDQGSLTLQAEPFPGIATALPNPLFLITRFLRPGLEDAEYSTPSLEDASAKLIEVDVSRFWESDGSSENARAKLVLVRPAVSIDGSVLFLYGFFDDKSRLVQIDSRTSAGLTIERVLFGEYPKAGGQPQLPARVTYQGLDEATKKVLVNLEFEIAWNPRDESRHAAQRFTLDPSESRIVLDADFREFLKHPNLSSSE